jgi:hypothetical protein
MAILGNSIKVAKGTKRGYLTAVCYLAPGNTSEAYGGIDVCPWRTEACSIFCLGKTSGQLALPCGQNAEAWKTLLFLHSRAQFLDILRDDVARLERRAHKMGKVPTVRLNGSSDIPWERVAPTLMSAFPAVQFYDYTKSEARVRAYLAGAPWPKNYHLTYSRGEADSDNKLAGLLDLGAVVAIVFDNTPDTWTIDVGLGEEHYGVTDGDETDLRFLDPPGTVCALTPKGHKIKKDTSGFVVR